MRMLVRSLVACWLLGAAASGADVWVQTVDGEPVRATTLRLAGDQLEVNAAGGATRIALDQVVALEVVEESAVPAPASDVAVLLRDGSLLQGRLLAGAEDVVRVSVPGLEDLEIGLDDVAAVSLGNAGERTDPARLAPRASEDVLYRRGGAAGDYLAGTLIQLGRDGVLMESGRDLGEVRMDVAGVAGVAVAAISDVPEDLPEGRAVQVELVGGGRLNGSLLEVSSGAVVLGSRIAPRLEVPMRAVRRVRFSSDRYAWLSDLEPAAVEQTPFIGGSDDFLFPWQRDRSVTGQPLLVGGERFGKGLGVHSRTRLTYELGGVWRRFTARVGVADEVLELGVPGGVVVRVRVDGEVRFESDVLRAGMPALPVDIDTSGAQRLEIEVDFADRGDVGDRAVIADAMLIGA